MRLFFTDGSAVELLDRDFVAQGGQASVFARNGAAYKIFERPQDTPSPTKVAELASIGAPAVVAPTRLVFDAAGQAVGYEMPLVVDGIPLAQLCTRAYQRRTGFTLADGLRLFDQTAEALDQIHRKGVVVVDLSDTNVLVTPAGPRMIDSDSWQTASAGATAITSTIRDPQLCASSQCFDAGNDWFAFAVIMFSVLAGIHPFKGRHPTVRGLDARMQAGISTFDPAVRLPPGCGPDGLPEPLRAWFHATFSTPARTRPPCVRNSHLPPRLRAHASSSGRGIDYPEPPRIIASVAGVLLAATTSALHLGRQKVADIDDGALGLGVLECGEPYVIRRDPLGRVEVTVHGHQTERITTGIKIDTVSQAGPMVWGLYRDRLFEITVRTVGRRRLATAASHRPVMPNARQIFAGAFFQRAGRTTVATLLGRGAGAPEVRLPALDRSLLIDACHSAGVLVVLTAREGRYDRHTYVFGNAARGSRDWAPRAYRCERDVAARGASVATDRAGITLAPHGDGWASFTRADSRDHASLRADPDLVADAVLEHEGRVFTLTESQLRHVSLP